MSLKSELCPYLTVCPGVGAADAGHRGASRHDEQVIPALAVCPLGLRQHKVGKVQSENKMKCLCYRWNIILPQLTDPVVQFVNCQSTRAHSEISDNNQRVSTFNFLLILLVVC